MRRIVYSGHRSYLSIRCPVFPGQFFLSGTQFECGLFVSVNGLIAVNLMKTSLCIPVRLVFPELLQVYYFLFLSYLV